MFRGIRERIKIPTGIYHFKNYFLSSVGIKALSLFSIPVLTRMLTKEEYGIVNVYGTFVAIFTVLFTLNSSSVITRFYFENKQNIGRMMATVLLIGLILPLLLISVIIWQSEFSSQRMNLPRNILFFFLSSTVLLVINTVLLQYSKARSDSVFIRNYNLAKGYTSFGLMIILIFVLPTDKYLASPITEAIILIIFGGIAMYKLWPVLKINIKKEDIRFIASYSIPLIPAGLSGLLLSQFDRIMLGNMKGMDQAGLYSFAYNIGALQTMVMNSLNSAYLPQFYKKMKVGNQLGMDADMKLIAQLLGGTAVILIFWGDILGMVLGDKAFHDGLSLIPIIILGLFFLSLNPFYKRGISYVKKTLYTSVIILFIGALNILLNYWFIPIYGMNAAAYTTLVSYILQFLITYIVVKFVLKVYVTSIVKISRPIVLVVISGGLYFTLDYLSLDLILNLLIRLLLTGVLVYLVIEKSPKQILNLIKK